MQNIQSFTSDPPEQQAARRPLVIWIAAIKLSLGIGPASYIVVRDIIHYWEFSVEYLLRGVLIPLFMLCFLYAIVIGLFRRWRWSRWLTFALLLAMAINYIMQANNPPTFTMFADMTGANKLSAEYRQGRMLGTMLDVSFNLFVALLLAFQPKVVAYFSPHAPDHEIDSQESLN